MSDAGAKGQWPEIVAIVFSILAVGISGYALFAGQRQHQDQSAAEVLERTYGEWFDMQIASADTWSVRHLDETPENYEQTRNQIRILTRDLPEKERIKVLLRERASANLLFISFEHLFKQWRLAQDINDPIRLQVLDEEIAFWTDVQLRNPRMLWLWSADGGGWVHGADPSTVAFYNARVLNNPDMPLQQVPDPDGIFAAEDDLEVE